MMPTAEHRAELKRLAGMTDEQIREEVAETLSQIDLDDELIFCTGDTLDVIVKHARARG